MTFTDSFGETFPAIAFGYFTSLGFGTGLGFDSNPVLTAGKSYYIVARDVLPCISQPPIGSFTIEDPNGRQIDLRPDTISAVGNCGLYGFPIGWGNATQRVDNWIIPLTGPNGVWGITYRNLGSVQVTGGTVTDMFTVQGATYHLVTMTVGSGQGMICIT